MIKHTLHILEFGKVIDYISKHATSKVGERKIKALLPYSDIEIIKQRLKEVSELKNILITEGDFPISGIRDIELALKKTEVIGSILQPAELLDIASCLFASRRIRKYFQDKDVDFPLLYNIVRGISILEDIEESINKAIDEHCFVKDSASSRLYRIRRDIEAKKQQIREKLTSILQNLEKSSGHQDDVITLRDDRYVIPLLQSRRSEIKGIIHDQSASGATVFIEPIAVLEMNNALRELRIQEKEEVERILRELTELVHYHHKDIALNFDILGQMDFIYAKASFSLELECSEPKLNQDGYIRLEKARHPLLLLSEKLTREQVVPLDITLGKDFNTLIITGPNTGGKTVALKTVGLLALLVKSGIHIPASPDSDVAIFGKVFADIGDEQSIERNLSTFSSHIQKVVKILKDADSNTLVLLDEIGVGTDPKEGSALAIAVLKELTKKGCRTIATTHYGNLKSFAHSEKGVENASMEFDQVTLKPTYNLRIGIPGSSYALEIAERLGVPKEVIQSAKSHLSVEDVKVSDLIIDLEEKLKECDIKTKSAEEKEKSMIKKIDDYQLKIEQLKNKEKEIRKNALEEADRIIKDSKFKFNNLLEEIKKRQFDKQFINEVKNIIKEDEKKIEKEIEKITPKKKLVPLSEWNVGDRVFISHLEQEGIITSLPDSQDMVTVQIGTFTLRTEVSNLYKPEGKSEEKKQNKIIGDGERLESAILLGKEVSAKIDVRGYSADEAVEKVDKHLDDASLAGLPFVEIIHGIGKGILREQITKMLQTHPKVKEYRPGDPSAGGIGVTIAKLRE